MFRIFKSSKGSRPDDLMIARLNDKIMPIDRGIIYEDPLDQLLRAHKYGEVTGGGTKQTETGEIAYCDLEILIYKNKYPELITDTIIKLLESQGAPKGSSLAVGQTPQAITFGKSEGLAIYLDGVSLPDNVYKECDINDVLRELRALTGDNGNIFRYWQGEAETALYFYGESFDKMARAIAAFVKAYPLCQGARIEQIA